MKKTIAMLLLSALLPSATVTAIAANITMKRISVHDPSVVWEPSTKRYYIFGSHRAQGYSTDLMRWNTLTAKWGLAKEDGTITNSDASNKKAFVTNMTKQVTKGGQQVDFGPFDAHAWSAAYGGDYSIDGNMWAPDVIWNPVMEKWCMYLSINGPHWNSSIILLTADRINGPYVYQGPVVISGFNVNGAPAALDYKNTDLQLVIGNQTSLPSRYNTGNKWGNRWPHCIDPCVFYDEQGKLWMSYGSWSGGIWMLELDEQTGLRDYDVTYPSTGGSTDAVSSDPYFGKKIAGGRYVSGEASYIEYIGGYYFLFVTYGGLEQKGGYQMRVFRSENPDGPYKDWSNRSAIFAEYALNFGPGSTNRGMNLFGAYGEWGNMITDGEGERSQGHNSIIAAEDGRTYLVYHTRFQKGGEGHQVRVHQVFQNDEGWLVAAPFEYTGEQVTSADIAATQQIATERIPGIYKLLTHKFGLDHQNMELATPVEVTLKSDGTIEGERSGKWKITPGTSYVTITIANAAYKGVLVEQMLEPKTDKTIAFTVIGKGGVSVWGYRSGDDPTGIVEIMHNAQDTRCDAASTKYAGMYSLNGQRLQAGTSGATTGTTATRHGITIERRHDGTFRKVLR
jgi:arabinan endo-1,5-alpha-L-arabinosidase